VEREARLVAHGVGMKRRVLVRALAIGVAFVLLCSFILWPRQPRVTQDRCARVRAGMTRAEVYEILGPPGDYSTGPVEFSGDQEYFRGCADLTKDWPTQFTERDFARWWGDAGCAWVRFDETERATACEFVSHSSIEQGPIESIIWRIRRKWF
jgi:hypothetical protein